MNLLLSSSSKAVGGSEGSELYCSTVNGRQSHAYVGLFGGHHVALRCAIGTEAQEGIGVESAGGSSKTMNRTAPGWCERQRQ